MKRSSLLMALLFTLESVFAQVPGMLQVKEYILDNGLTVWINEDHSQPKVYGALVVKAGAKDSPNTGIAHYFEHIMFKGTEKIGTVDYNNEKIYLDSIALKYDELSRINDSKERSEIQKEINRLSIKSAEYAIPNEFAKLISKYGGTKLNAFTSYDLTSYFNEFSPQYFKQWALINSERVINPVFRLFQSELETVYEEKNMYYDQLGYASMEKLLERIFTPHPYMYPIIGSTENLKNPRLSEMKRFYDDYYVAGNMALIISGDVNDSDVLPVIESTFGRIKSGKAPSVERKAPLFFDGKESVQINFPIPVVKAGGYVWRGVPLNHGDEIPLTILSRLLNNSNSTGYLDKLIADQKIMAAFLLNMSMNEAGFLGLIVIPKLLFQSLGKAFDLVDEQISRIKRGDISEEDVENVKNELKIESFRQLESIDTRSRKMMDVVASGKSWEDYLQSISSIDNYSKDDIVRIANRYLTSDYLYVTKKTGNYPKDLLPKPEFEPIIPKNRNESSQFAQDLEKIESKFASPRFIDFDKDIKTVALSDRASLYHTQNPANDIFSMTISFKKGSSESRLLTPLSSYLSYLGTEKYTFDDFRRELQKMGSTMDFSVTSSSFNVNITGLNKNTPRTLELVADFFKSVEGDQKKIKQIVEMKQLEDKSVKESPDALADALFEWISVGERSSYLNRLSAAEIGKLSSQELLNEFREIQRVQCDIYYCGNLTPEAISGLIKDNIAVDRIDIDSNNPVSFNYKEYNEPMVYFINMPKAKQSIVKVYMKGSDNRDEYQRAAAQLYSSYFGGNMSSLVFQEVREFRSLAYRASISYSLNRDREKAGMLRGTLSTQAEKTVEAIALVDSLIRSMPVEPDRVDNAKQEIINQIYNNYPSFRDISSKISYYREVGYDKDPNRELLRLVEAMTIKDIESFFDNNIKGKNPVYMIIGDEKSIDMNRLAEYGKIIRIKTDNIYK